MEEGIYGYDEVLNIPNASFLNDDEDTTELAKKKMSSSKRESGGSHKRRAVTDIFDEKFVGFADIDCKGKRNMSN
ncbi:hypothetical protein SUGI_0912600 [Cryptomeria japonica]|nr:hypothetical protein SUGI_0912600 [Cryptomeria japonica]